MSRIESLRKIWDSLEPDPYIRLEGVESGVYKIYFSRGDTSRVSLKFWARVLRGVDPNKKGGYALLGERWIHSGDKVRDGDIIAYNKVGSGKHGNMIDVYVSAVLYGKAKVLSFCNWSDRDEKQGFIEDLEDIFKSLDEGTTREKFVDSKVSSEEIGELKETVRKVSDEQRSVERGISDFLEYRTIGKYENGCIRVKSDIFKMLDLKEGDFCIVTLEIPGIRKR